MSQNRSARISFHTAEHPLQMAPKVSLRLTSHGWLSPAILGPLPMSYVPQASAGLDHVAMGPGFTERWSQDEGPAVLQVYETVLDAITDDFLRRSADASRQLFNQVCTYVDTHLGEAVTPEALAKAAGLKLPFLTRLIRAHADQTVSAFVRERRLGVALARLQSSVAPLSSIARDCGFSSQSYFSLLIRKKTGVTPLAYRRTHLRKLHLQGAR